MAIWKNKTKTVKFFMNPPTKKQRPPECTLFKTIQLLFEAFFDITKILLRIKKILNKKDWDQNSPSISKIFAEKLDCVLGEHDMTRGRLLKTF